MVKPYYIEVENPVDGVEDCKHKWENVCCTWLMIMMMVVVVTMMMMTMMMTMTMNDGKHLKMKHLCPDLT